MPALNTQQLQQTHQQRPPAMSLKPVNPVLSHKIPIEHQQRLRQNQQLQPQYQFGQQSQPQMGLYSPQVWYPLQEQQYQGIPPTNYQYWYGMNQHVNSPQVFQYNSLLPGSISPSSYQQQNGVQRQVVSTGQPQKKPATKARSRPASKDQAQIPTKQSRPKAGGRMYIPRETSADCSLNKIDSISKFQSDKGARFRECEQDVGINRCKADLTKDLAKTQMKVKLKEKKHEQEKEIVKKEINKVKEQEVEPSLGSGASSLFRRLACYMRFRSSGKAKARKNENCSNDVTSQGSSPKKRGFFSRLFGEVDPYNQAQSKRGSHFHGHYPTNVPTTNIDQEEVREAEGFHKVQAARLSRKRLGNYGVGGVW